MDLENLMKDAAYGKGFLRDWVDKEPVQVKQHLKEHLEALIAGYDALQEQVKKLNDQAVQDQDKIKKQGEMIDSLLQLGGIAAALGKVDDLNEGRDEQTIIAGEFVGWRLVGGIRLSRAAAIRDELDAPMLKVLLLSMNPNVQTDFDIFPLAVKRGPDGALHKLVVDFTKTMDH